MTEEDLKEPIIEIIKILNTKIDNMENKSLKFPIDVYTTLMSKLIKIEEEFEIKKNQN